MRNFKKSRFAVLACLLVAVLALTAALTLYAFASEVTTEFTGTQITLTDGINIRFVGTLAEADRTGATLDYTVADTTGSVAIVADTDGNFAVDVPVGAAQMAQTVTAKIMVGGTAKDTEEQSVKGYAATLLADDEAAAAEKLVVSEMLRYGAEAYKYDNDGAASNLLDGLTLSDALLFPDAPVYTYEVGTKADATDSFKEIQLTLTEALKLTLTTNAGISITESMMISAFFDEITVDNVVVAAPVTVTPSLYAELAKGDAELGALVKALYNYAVAVKKAMIPDANHVHTLDAGTYDAAAKTITYTCTGCMNSFSTEVFALEQFTGHDTSAIGNPAWRAQYQYLKFAYDEDDPTFYGPKTINLRCFDDKMPMIKTEETFGVDPTHKVTGVYPENVHTYYTDGTDVNKLAFGFDLTMAENGFSTAAIGEEEPGALVRISARAGGYPNAVFDDYCAMLKGNKLVFFIGGEEIGEGEEATRGPSTEIDVYTFAPNETANVVFVYELSVVEETTYMTTTAYINGVEKAEYTVEVNAVDGGFGTTKKSHVHFIVNGTTYNASALNTGYTLDNMYVANDFTGFAAHEHTMDTGTYDATTNTIIYTCTECFASYSTEVFAMEQFTGEDAAFPEKWYGQWRYMGFATNPDDLSTYDKQVNVKITDNQVSIVKDVNTYAIRSDKKDTGFFVEGIQTNFTDGTNTNKVAFGFDLTMPTGGFSNAAEGEPGYIARIGACAGDYPNRKMDSYCAMLRGDKLVFFIAGDADAEEPDIYIDVYTFAPNESANVVLVYELSVVEETTYMKTTAYINGVAKANYTVEVDAVTGGFGTTAGAHIQFLFSANAYHNSSIGAGVIVDNMYIANDFTGFAN